MTEPDPRSASTSGERKSFSLPPPAELRDRATRLDASARRVGRPRKRYLSERRHELARAMTLAYAGLAATTILLALCDRFLSYFPPEPIATAAEVVVVLVAAVTAAIAPVIANRSPSGTGASLASANLALAWLHGIATTLCLLGYGVACRATGGGASPYVFLLPLLDIFFGVVVPAPAYVAAAGAVASYGALLVAGPSAPPPVHLVTVAVGIAVIILAKRRGDRALRIFLRTERLSAAVARLRRLQEQLVIVEKLEALRVLVGGMAHELNNALAISIASNAQMGRDLERDVNLARAALGRSDGGLARIKRTVDRLRRFAMAAEGVLEPADVAAMLDFALESAIGRARSGVVVERKYDANVGAIEVHVSALAEALFQVARNAIEAMPGGGTIEASVRAEGDRVVLSVADQGAGIPPDQISRVFDPFYSRGAAKSAQKSGLGLSAVYGLVTAVGGHVEIKSELGRGTEVAIIMPARRASMRPPAK
jgi:signal transduction histidine kinase